MVKATLISLLCGSFTIFNLFLSCMSECIASVMVDEAVICRAVINKSIVNPSDKLVRQQRGDESSFQWEGMHSGVYTPARASAGRQSENSVLFKAALRQ